MPSNYQLAMVWQARKGTVSEELNIPAGYNPNTNYNPKVLVDCVAKELIEERGENGRPKNKFYKVPDGVPKLEIDPLRADVEAAYSHLKSHILTHSEKAHIRFLEFTIS